MNGSVLAIPDPVLVLMADDPLLRSPSVAVEEFGEALAPLLEAMRKIASARQARGLAAVQIGVPVRALIAISGEPSRRRQPEYIAFINPALDRTLNRCASEREGCLSVPPRKWGEVSRPAKCDARWFDEFGAEHSATLAGDLARIFQHEFDHLNGVLMTDRMAAQPARLAASG